MELNVLVEQDGDRFIAHALEFNLISVGDTPAKCIEHIKDNVITYLIGCIDAGLSL